MAPKRRFKLPSIRKLHRNGFGYLRLLSVASASLMVLIFVTGVLMNHAHSLPFLRSVQVPLSILPDRFTERVTALNDAQASIPGAALTGAPLEWVVWDLHTGDFFGPYGRLLYDAIALILLMLALTGLYLYLSLRHAQGKAKRLRARTPSPEDAP